MDPQDLAALGGHMVLQDHGAVQAAALLFDEHGDLGVHQAHGDPADLQAHGGLMGLPDHGDLTVHQAGMSSITVRLSSTPHQFTPRQFTQLQYNLCVLIV